MKKALITFGLFLSLIWSLGAEKWEPIGPWGGTVIDLETVYVENDQPDRRTKCYAITKTGLYKSENCGKTWEKVSIPGSERYGNPLIVKAVYCPCSDRVLVYVAFKRAVFFSGDGGENWSDTNIFVGGNSSIILIEPWIRVTESSSFCSLYYGVEEISPTGPTYSLGDYSYHPRDILPGGGQDKPLDLVVYPGAERNILALVTHSLSDWKVWRGVVGAEDVEWVKGAHSSTPQGAFLLARGEGDVLYAANKTTIWKCDNLSADDWQNRWHEIELPRPTGSEIVRILHQGGLTFAALKPRGIELPVYIAYSRDDERWDIYTLQNLRNYGQIVDFAFGWRGESPGGHRVPFLLIGTDCGMVTTSTAVAGTMWEWASQGVPFDKLDFFTLGKSTQTIFASTAKEKCLFKTTNQRQSWERIDLSYLPSERYITKIKMCETNSQIGYQLAHLRGNPSSPALLYQTSDGGNTWQEVGQVVEIYPFPQWENFVVHPTNSQLLYTLSLIPNTADLCALHKSENGGRDWQVCGPPEGYFCVEGLANIALIGETIYLPAVKDLGNDRFESVVLRSEDRGQTWQEEKVEGRTPEGEPYVMTTIAADQNDPRRLYGLAVEPPDDYEVDFYFFKRVEQGIWQKVSKIGSVSLVMLPGKFVVDGSCIFLGGAVGPDEGPSMTDNMLFFYSADGGQTWENLIEGLPRPLEGGVAVGTLGEYDKETKSLYILWNDVINENSFGIFKRSVKDLVNITSRIQLTQISLAPVYPNPFNPECYIPLKAKGKMKNVKCKIYNILGQLVREIEISDLSSQISNSVYWDGRDSRGLEVPSGVYFYEITGEGVQRMVVLR